MPKRLLCISYRFPPETYPLAIRVQYFLNHLCRKDWALDAVTAAPDAALPNDGATVHHVPSRTPSQLFRRIRDFRLGKLLDLLVWPDPYVFWAWPAYRKARELTRHNRYDAVATFMMPHSVGIAGLLMKRATGLPLVMNMNDSLTCSDMHPEHPTALHYRLARALEDQYVQSADAAIYVSRRNMERVRRRQPSEHHDTFHLIRRGAQRPSSPKRTTSDPDTFRIVYTGGTSGWYKFLEDEHSLSLPKRLYRAWEEAGCHTTANLDYRTHGPVYVGRAVKQVIDRHPEWKGRVHVDIYGERYPRSVTDAVLSKFGISDIVDLQGQVPHDEALRQIAAGDLLFMALPNRLDGSPGGRISAKTYEYLMTDRPILAALPPVENRENLQDKPGVHLTSPDGINAMADVIANLTGAQFSGESIAVDRSALRPSLSSTARAERFERVVNGVARLRPAANGELASL
jgi:hypothetical protein